MDLSLPPRLGQKYPTLSFFVGGSEGWDLESNNDRSDKLGYTGGCLSLGGWGLKRVVHGSWGEAWGPFD